MASSSAIPLSWYSGIECGFRMGLFLCGDTDHLEGSRLDHGIESD